VTHLKSIVSSVLAIQLLMWPVSGYATLAPQLGDTARPTTQAMQVENLRGNTPWDNPNLIAQVFEEDRGFGSSEDLSTDNNNDTSTIVAISILGGLAIFALISYFWHRRHSKSDFNGDPTRTRTKKRDTLTSITNANDVYRYGPTRERGKPPVDPEPSDLGTIDIADDPPTTKVKCRGGSCSHTEYDKGVGKYKLVSIKIIPLTSMGKHIKGIDVTVKDPKTDIKPNPFYDTQKIYDTAKEQLDELLKDAAKYPPYPKSYDWKGKVFDTDERCVDQKNCYCNIDLSPSLAKTKKGVQTVSFTSYVGGGPKMQWCKVIYTFTFTGTTKTWTGKCQDKSTQIIIKPGAF